MTAAITASHHETARLFFMEVGGLVPRPNVIAFRDWMRSEHPEMDSMALILLWRDYTGTELRGPARDWLTGSVL